MRKEIGKF